jgi:hypothetical protein
MTENCEGGDLCVDVRKAVSLKASEDILVIESLNSFMQQ